MSRPGSNRSYLRHSPSYTGPQKKKGRCGETLKCLKTEKKCVNSVTLVRAAPLFPSIAPTQRLDVYVFGRNDYGQLGLGDSVTQIEYPKLNPKLAAGTVGVVHLAVGGAHAAALTYDNQILTWGDNSDRALGRGTTEDGSDDDDEEEEKEENDCDGNGETVWNMREAVPLPVDLIAFPAGTVFTHLAATESATFVLTSTGLVYGWGTFRTFRMAPTTIHIPGLTKVVKIVAGAQHMLALTSEGKVFSWGSNEQRQLGRRRLRHNPPHHLAPAQCGLPSGIVDLSAGHYHSFAIHRNGDVYAWGLNNYMQTVILSGIDQYGGATVEFPTKVPSLARLPNIITIQGGKDHSHAIDQGRQCYSWGRIDNMGIGVNPRALLDPDVIFRMINSQRIPEILKVPVVASPGLLGVECVGVGIDHSIVITNTGEGYSWGINAQHQTGHPGAGDDIVNPRLLRSNDIDGQTLVFASCGRQFSIVAGVYTSVANNSRRDN
ncbi:regulator of chromosome condensation 1/beta-lactamase-inhibitor protein II [Aspergillus granulosus]|uniref:Regulator of chromosome condensation 1/beta-lactamase-inhibitor protein II n=1 Tax=Aspergillus granulosus TaxID=176169 RepID=A0ABR4H7S4_9EURO